MDKIYRVAWALNKFSKFSFSRSEDVEIRGKQTGDKAYFPLYIQNDAEREIEYLLVGNKGTSGFLVPEAKMVNYFVIIRGEADDNHAKEINLELQSNPNILNSFVLDSDKLKSKNNLII